MKKSYILTGILIASFLMLCNIFVNAQSNRDCTLFEDFENISPANPGYAGNNNVTSPSGSWMILGYGTMDANDRYLGAKSIRLRANTNDPATDALTIPGENTTGANVIQMQFDKTDGIENVSFYYGSYSDHSGGEVFVQYSTNGGVTWLTPANNSVAAPAWAGEMQQFTVSINVPGNIRMRIIKYKQTGTKNSINIDNICVTSYSGTPTTVATPTFSPSSGTYFTPQNVTINCATDGATIRYTTNGSEPTETSTLFTTPINISTTTTLKAKAWKSGLEPSSIATATYTFPINVPNIAAFKAAHSATSTIPYKITGDVTFVFRSGRYIYIKDATAGLVIFDNSTPTITSTYNNGDVISGGVVGTCTIYNGLYELIPSNNTAAGVPGAPVTPKVITMSDLLDNFSDYESQLICIENVTFDEGTFGTGATANINMYQNDDMMVCRNHYGNLTGYSTIEELPFHVIGFPIPFNDDRQLAPRDEDDIIPAGQMVATPVFSPNGGNYEEPVLVTITSTTENAEIRYTTDGAEPTQTSTLFTESFTVSTTTTIKARGFHADLNPSLIATATYKFPNPDQVATPTFSPQGGVYTDVLVTINCSTDGASIYYTLNGNEPTEQDILFEAPIEIPEGATVLKARAFKDGMDPSEVATASYTVGIGEWDTQIKIYPNPTTGQLIINNEQLTINNVEVYDVYGRKLSSHHLIISSSHHKIDISYLQAGIYFVRIETEKGEIVKKVVKQ